ncbi:hypothetical protein ACLD0W_00565 [Alloalcanivorax sp. C16-1]|uniref:hypothetical protein n=1 Tax=Alloalcanivorax sp. C16-1 TaxID=3390051 RepID=UPI003970B096
MNRTSKRRHGGKMPWTQLYLHGLGVSVSHNAQAFGFSILITVSYGVVSSVADDPTPLQLIGFALSAVASLSFLNLMVAFLKRDEPDDSERTPVLLVATATDFISVGAGLAAAFGVAKAFENWMCWLVAPFAAGLIYCLVQGLQIAVARRGADIQE